MNFEVDYTDRWTTFDTVGFGLLCTLILVAILGVYL